LGKINDISIYGQESNQTTWRLAKMNLAIRGIDSSQVKWNNEGSFFWHCPWVVCHIASVHLCTIDHRSSR
jgi:hypothetical protein